MLFVDYSGQRKIQECIANKFEEGEVQIQSRDTNIKFEIAGLPHFCDGRTNNRNRFRAHRVICRLTYRLMRSCPLGQFG